MCPCVTRYSSYLDLMLDTGVLARHVLGEADLYEVEDHVPHGLRRARHAVDDRGRAGRDHGHRATGRGRGHRRRERRGGNDLRDDTMMLQMARGVTLLMYDPS